MSKLVGFFQSLTAEFTQRTADSIAYLPARLSYSGGLVISVAFMSAVVVFLFLTGLWFTEANINGPNFHPKLTLAAPTIGYSVSCCASCLLAQQDSVDG